jgi:hypothetical protein
MAPPLRYDGTLRSFFYEQLDAAQAQRGAELEDDVEAYVVNLLAEFARRTDAAGRTSGPLATQYLVARRTGPRALRDVGDRALYIAGVVPASLDRGAVSVGYVRSIGESAYREVSVSAPALDVFERLADAFGTLTDLLGDVLDPGQTESAGDLLGLYERWRRHGRAADARRLLAAGVMLDPDGADVVQ